MNVKEPFIVLQIHLNFISQISSLTHNAWLRGAPRFLRSVPVSAANDLSHLLCATFIAEYCCMLVYEQPIGHLL